MKIIKSETKKVKRIVFLAYNLGQGGAERQLFHFVMFLINSGHVAEVISFTSGGYWETKLVEKNVKVHVITASNKIMRIWKLLRIIKDGEFNIIHSFQFGLNLYAVLVSIILGRKNIGSIRNDLWSEIRSLGGSGVMSLLLPSKMVVNSSNAWNSTRHFITLPQRTLLIHNFVDTTQFFPLRHSARNKFKVITVGTIWYSKRVDRVIEIAEIFSKQGIKNVTFEIIGDGEDFGKIQNYALSKGLLNTLIYLKPRTDKIAEEYQQADALLLTSDFEGTPNVVLEALACGLPVVATCVGDVPELVINGITGFSHQPEDLAGMVGSIKYLYNNPGLCLQFGLNGRKLIQNNYSKHQFVEKISQLYELEPIREDINGRVNKKIFR